MMDALVETQTVLTNATMITHSLSSIGLEINNSKCALLLINHTMGAIRWGTRGTCPPHLKK